MPEVQSLVTASMPHFQFGGRALETPEDYKRLMAEYTGWAYACIQKNATAVAQVPLRLYRGVPRNATTKVRKCVPVRPVSKARKAAFMGEAKLQYALNKAVDVEEVLEHPWHEMVMQANRSLNGFELFQTTVMFKQATGNAYWLIALSPQGVPMELWPLASQWVRIVPSETKYIESYQYGASKPFANYPPEQIAHFKYPNPHSMYYGMGPLHAAFTSASLNEDFDEFERAMLDNGAIMPAVFSIDHPVGPEQIKRLRKEIMRVHGGHKKSGKLGLLQHGLSLLPAAWNPKDINYAIGMKMTKEKVAGILGVPLSLLGVEDVNRANADAGNYSYMRDTVAPECRAEADIINQDIMPLYDEKLFVWHDDCVPENMDYVLKKQSARLERGVWSINEVREMDGMEPVAAGDEALLPGTLKPLSQVVAEPAPVPTALGGVAVGQGGDGSDAVEAVEEVDGSDTGA